MSTQIISKLARMVLLLAALAIALTGCAPKSSVEFTADQVVGMSQEDNRTSQACYQATGERLTQELALLQAMTPERQYLYLMQRMNNQTILDVVGMFTGRSSDPCQGKNINVFSLLMKEIEERNESYRETIRTGGSVAKFGLGAWAASDVFGSIMSAVGTRLNLNVEGNENQLADLYDQFSAGKNGMMIQGDANAAEILENQQKQIQQGETTGANAIDSPIEEIVAE